MKPLPKEICSRCDEFTGNVEGSSWSLFCYIEDEAPIGPLCNKCTQYLEDKFDLISEPRRCE